MSTPVHGVDDGHDAVEPEAQREIGMADDRLQNGHGIGETRRLDHDTRERRDAAVVEPPQQILQRAHEIASDRAAQAAGGHQQHVAVDLLDEQMIEPDRAEFVDENDSVGKRPVAQQIVQQRRLARAEEAGEHDDRDRRRRTPRERESVIRRAFSSPS